MLGPLGWVLAIALVVPLAPLAFGEPLSDKAVTEQILASLADQPLARGPLDEAKRALDRAAGARRSGDIRHVELLEGLAREWAETARDVVRAAAVEAEAGALEIAAADAGLQAERGRALLEESIARRGRAEAELEKLTADDPGAPGEHPKGWKSPAGGAGIFPTKPPPASSARPKSTKGAR